MYILKSFQISCRIHSCQCKAVKDNYHQNEYRTGVVIRNVAFQGWDTNTSAVFSQEK